MVQSFPLRFTLNHWVLRGVKLALSMVCPHCVNAAQDYSSISCGPCPHCDSLGIAQSHTVNCSCLSLLLALPEINECGIVNVCSGHGECIEPSQYSLVKMFSCKCHDGWTGSICNISKQILPTYSINSSCTGYFLTDNG